MNLPLSILLAGLGTIVAYSAVTDQQGGPLGTIRRALARQPQTAAHAAATDASLLASAASGDSTSTATASTASSVAGSNSITTYALSFVGVPYLYGGVTPSGWDCSGFTRYVYAHFGISLPRVAAAQSLVGTKVEGGISAAQPGDQLFFGTPAYHTGIYLGNGNMVDAPHTGTVTRVESLSGWRDLSSIRRRTTSSAGTVAA